MAETDPAGTLPGWWHEGSSTRRQSRHGDGAGTAGVLAGPTAQLARTMALCGLDEVRSVPRDSVTPSPWSHTAH